jgi:hypothetical protein
VSAGEAIPALALARLRVALDAGRALAVATALCVNSIFKFLKNLGRLKMLESRRRTDLTLAGALGGVAVVTGSAQLARLAGRARFAFEALASQSVAPVRRPDFVVAAAVARLAESAGHQRVAVVTVSAPETQSHTQEFTSIKKKKRIRHE